MPRQKEGKKRKNRVRDVKNVLSQEEERAT